MKSTIILSVVAAVSSVSTARVIGQPRLFDILNALTQGSAAPQDDDCRGAMPMEAMEMIPSDMQSIASDSSNAIGELLSSILGATVVPAHELQARHANFAQADPFEQMFAAHRHAMAKQADEMAMQQKMMASRVHVKENGTRLAISVELPGFAMSELQVSLHADTLTVTGDHKCPVGQENEGAEWCQNMKFSEVIRVGSGAHVVLKDASVKYDNGVLVVLLPKGDAADSAPLVDDRVLQINSNPQASNENGKLTLQMV